MPDSYLRFRTDLDRAVKAFRPILRALHLRQKGQKPEVFLAKFATLDLLDLNNWSIQVVPMDLITHGLAGAFALKEKNNNGKVHYISYIFIEQSLYSKLDNCSADDRERIMQEIKHIGIHEFVHFIAWIYTITVDNTDEARTVWMKRFEERLVTKTSDKFIKELLNALNTNELINYFSNPDFKDSHYRVRPDSSIPRDNDLDYSKLFLRFLFSRELFEEQYQIANIKTLLSDSSLTKDEKKHRLREAAYEIAKEKSIQALTADHRLAEWIEEYFKPEFISMAGD